MGSHFDEEHGVSTQTAPRVKVPKRYKVIILNDDYTAMEFVVFILQTVFHKSEQEALTLMLAIHHTGSGIAGVFSFEVAEMKANLVTQIAREHEYPLRCILEEE